MSGINAGMLTRLLGSLASVPIYISGVRTIVGYVLH